MSVSHCFAVVDFFLWQMNIQWFMIIFLFQFSYLFFTCLLKSWNDDSEWQMKIRKSVFEFNFYTSIYDSRRSPMGLQRRRFRWVARVLPEWNHRARAEGVSSKHEMLQQHGVSCALFWLLPGVKIRHLEKWWTVHIIVFLSQFSHSQQYFPRGQVRYVRIHFQ